MKLSECVYGILVQRESDGEIGMVVGITNNVKIGSIEEQKSPLYAVPLVSWQCGITSPIHYAYLSIFKD